MFSDCFDTSGSMIALSVFEILALDGFCDEEDEEELGILIVGLKLPKTYIYLFWIYATNNWGKCVSWRISVHFVGAGPALHCRVRERTFL